MPGLSLRSRTADCCGSKTNASSPVQKLGNCPAEGVTPGVSTGLWVLLSCAGCPISSCLPHPVLALFTPSLAAVSQLTASLPAVVFSLLRALGLIWIFGKAITGMLTVHMDK